VAAFGEIGKHIPGSSYIGNAILGLLTIPAVIFSDNLMRATAALLALEHRTDATGWVSLRVGWKLFRMAPSLLLTQITAALDFDRGWLVGDCLWPVVSVIERVSGMTAVRRSRAYLTGINSAARALAIRHLVPALFVLAQTVSAMRTGATVEHLQTRVLYSLFLAPFFVVIAAAPLALYDRTSDNPIAPLAVPHVSRDDDFRRFSISWSTAIWVLIPFLIWLAGESPTLSQAFATFADL
ncbi:MAG: hypothetical protein ABI823_09210, partial [Bryobacteraceae bacterium]